MIGKRRAMLTTTAVAVAFLLVMVGCANPEHARAKSTIMQTNAIEITQLGAVFGRTAEDRSQLVRQPGLPGALAALETFYFAFNHKSLDGLDRVWANDRLVSLCNPLGGVLRGSESIRSLYHGICAGPTDVWVEFHDIVAYVTTKVVIFAGRERGEFTKRGETTKLAIRTSRVFAWFGPEAGWRQVHHHGSIDEPEALRSYQSAVRGR